MHHPHPVPAPPHIDSWLGTRGALCRVQFTSFRRVTWKHKQTLSSKFIARGPNSLGVGSRSVSLLSAVRGTNPTESVALMERPVVLCGLGRVGWRVLESLRAAGVPVVVIDIKTDPGDPRLAGVPCACGIAAHGRRLLGGAGRRGRRLRLGYGIISPRAGLPPGPRPIVWGRGGPRP